MPQETNECPSVKKEKETLKTAELRDASDMEKAMFWINYIIKPCGENPKIQEGVRQGYIRRAKQDLCYFTNHSARALLEETIQFYSKPPKAETK